MVRLAERTLHTNTARERKRTTRHRSRQRTANDRKKPRGTARDRKDYKVEVCMGLGISIGMAFPWESHGNENSFLDTNGNRSGIGNNVMGMGMADL